MTFGDIYKKAKKVIGEENIVDYRPAVFSGNPDTMFDFEVGIPQTIMIWLKNGDTMLYRANSEE